MSGSMKVCRRVCDDCPFRVSSLPGWIGAHESPREISRIVWLSRDGFPCHTAVNAMTGADGGGGAASFGDAVVAAPRCRGSLHMLANAFKVPVTPGYAAAVEAVGVSAEVFRHWSEFEAHHGLVSSEPML